MIRIDAVWLARDPLDMRAGMDTALARVVQVFGAAHPHQAYVFTNRRCNRLKVFVHDGLGVWLASRRLNRGTFVWNHSTDPSYSISTEQLAILVMGLPWNHIGDAGVIRII
jgi:transposase